MVIVLTAMALVILVALSRVYLGVHYLSDVLAGFAEAMAWLTFCLLGIHTPIGDIALPLANASVTLADDFNADAARKWTPGGT